MIQQPQQAGHYLSQQNVPLMVEVRPERQIESMNNLTEEEKKLVNSIWCRYCVEMILLIYFTFWGFPFILTYVVDGIFIINVLLFTNIKGRNSPTYQAMLALFNSSRVTIYGATAVFLFINYINDEFGWNLVYAVMSLTLFFIIISDVISLLTLFSKNNSEYQHQQEFLMNNQSQQQQQQQQPHIYYPTVTQPVQIINQENTLGTQPQPSLIPQTICNTQSHQQQQQQQQELPQQIYYSTPQYIPPPPQILQQQGPNYPSGNYFNTKY